ncbi:uncharacterized protein LOC111274943 [Durio zibethinus]|uniref:Uncharacterized protein LOC111274943 n=1 Tax=Durio zibethinus TaxID=66656 RepID=A0A6P5WHY0_DURZI|nr:uncharacterized protein LOC111274943 [Durio zibethinus]
MESTGSKLFTFFPILFLLLSTLSQPSSSSSPADSIIDKDSSVSWYRTLLAVQRNNKNQIPNCVEMVSRSQCLQNPKCRWCHSEALDDMCFSRAEAWRLPQQMIPLQLPA